MIVKNSTVNLTKKSLGGFKCNEKCTSCLKFCQTLTKNGNDSKLNEYCITKLNEKKLGGSKFNEEAYNAFKIRQRISRTQQKFQIMVLKNLKSNKGSSKFKNLKIQFNIMTNQNGFTTNK